WHMAPPAAPNRGGGEDREREDWGFLLAGPGAAPQPSLAAGGPVPRSLGGRELREGARAADDARLPGLIPSTLVHPRYWEDV
ncbi:spermidine synthase, partial [Streptomyces sp. NPDC055107]